jgi:hypothetical protein
MTGRCTAFFRNGGAMDRFNVGNCVYTDAQGDMLFEETERGAGEAVTTGRWVGGTGKYAGVTGTLTIQSAGGFGARAEGERVGATPVPGLYELYPMNAVTKTGTYTLPPL